LGPVDPRKYSAVTGLRGIDAFVIEGEAGKGAYGTVRKAREKGIDGLAFGVSPVSSIQLRAGLTVCC
jgi:protein-serine/threonine kinase